MATVEVSSPAITAAAPVESVAQTREAPVAQAFVADAPQVVPATPEVQVAPAAAEPAVSVQAPKPPAPKEDPKALLSTAGLVMIETDQSKSKSYQLEEEKVQLGRPRRERPKQAAEELMQVETKN
jgi:hypothetical protein